MEDLWKLLETTAEKNYNDSFKEKKKFKKRRIKKRKKFKTASAGLEHPAPCRATYLIDDGE